jgi:4-amino-4-deoxy-L-arabinose transferase-like glycosyltransferase
MKRWKFSPLTIIIFIGSIIRLPGMFQMLWYDEAYTAMLAHLPVGQMIQVTLLDVHPPTYYFLTLLSSRLLGWNEFALRLPSLILGMMAIYLAYRFASNLFDHRIGLVTAGLMALNPFMIYYSTEARMYALLTVAVLMACIGAVESRWWLLGIGTGMMLISHNMSVIYLPALVILVLAHVPTRSNKYIEKIAAPFGIMAAGAAPWVAWLPHEIHQATTGQFSQNYWISYFTGSPFAKLLAELTQLWFPHFRPEWVARMGALVTFSLILFPVIEAIRRMNRRALLCAALAFVPGLVSLAISLAWQPVILARTFIAGLPMWGTLVAWWLLLPRKWNVGKGALIGVAAALVLTCDVSFFSYDRSFNMKAMLDWLSANASQKAVVCHTSESTGVFFSFYYRGISYPLRNAASSECDWLLDERYSMPDQQTYDRADELIHQPGSTRVMIVLENPVVKTDLWKIGK